MVDTIADPVVVRRLAGKRSPTIVTDAEIETAIQFSDTYVKTYTQHYDWSAADADYKSVKGASEFIASSEIRAGFPDENDESEDQWLRAHTILDKINEHSAAAGVGGQVNIRTRPYRTFPSNPNALYRRPSSVAGSAGATEGLRQSNLVD